MSFIAVAIGGAAVLGVGGAMISANAAGNAASAQTDAAKSAAQLQHEDAQSALDFQKQQYNTSQTNAAPWLGAGQGAISNLSYLMGIPGSTPAASNGMVARNGTAAHNNIVSGQPVTLDGTTGQTVSGSGLQLHNNLARPVSGIMQDGTTAQPVANDPNALNPGTSPTAPPANTAINPSNGGFGSLAQGWDKTFQAPTAATEQNDPGYQFRLDRGKKAMESSAAASGNLLTGGTANAEQQFGQNYASNEYGNVYNRKIGEYQQGYNEFQNNQANEFNRLSAISGTGQVTANQLANTGQAAANNTSTTMLTSGGQIGQNYNNAGAATASGYVGQANAYSGALNNIGNSATSLAMMKNYGIGTAGTAGAGGSSTYMPGGAGDGTYTAANSWGGWGG